MRVALTKGTLFVPPTYFAIEHARRMPDVEWRVHTLLARVTDPTVTLPIVEATPLSLRVGSGALSPRTRSALKWASLGVMSRQIVAGAPDIVHQQQATWSLPAVRAAAQLDAPLVTTLHGGDVHALLPSAAGGAPARTWNRLNARRAFTESTRLLAVSRHLADLAIEAGARPARLHVHHQGVDTDWWTPIDEVGAAPGSADDGARAAAGRLGDRTGLPRLLFVGALSALKGLPEVVGASLALSDTLPHRLDVVGDGPLRGKVESVSAASPWIRVHGALGRERVREFMRAADLLVLPTRPLRGRAEAAGLVLLEAQACGTPVLVGRVGGTPEMVVAGETGRFLAADAGASDVAVGITRFFGLSEQDRARMGRAAREWVVRERSVSRAVTELREHYAEVLATGR